MKKQVLILIAVLLTTNYVKAQINANPDPNGPVWMTGDCNPLTVCSFDDIPVLHLSDTSQNTQLPLRVQNDTLKFFPPVYDQGSIYCCTFASEIGYIFTYEMNRKRDASAGSAWSLTNGLDTIDLRNLYHPLFGYNFINDGNYLDKTCQTDGFKLLQSIGCPMYNYYYTNLSNLPGSVKAKYWMSSFDGYANAIHQKVDSIYQIQFNPYVYSTFDTLKHWLYDHNEGEGNIGGLASIAILTGGDSIVTLQNGDAIFYRLGNDPSTGHVVTIVGYDDEICYDLNNNGHIEQDEHGAFRVANSWGTNWGSGGFIWLPYKLMRNLQDKRRMAFCCTVKEWEPTVYVKGTWVHPHQYAKRNKFNVVLGTRAHSYGGMIDSESHDYPIFSQQGGPNSLQGINNADSICIGFDYSCLFQDLDNVGKYFIKIYNYSHTSGNKIKNLTLVDYRWNEIFELPFESEEYAIDDETKIIGIKYELLPFSTGIGSSVSYNWDVIARRRTSVSGNNACLQFSNKATVDMYGTESYDSELFIDEGSMLYIGDSCKVIARSGNCRIIIKGSLTLGNGVTFEARDGATLEIIYENDADLAISNATFINCDLKLPNRNISFSNCHFIGTPFSATALISDEYLFTLTLLKCSFIPNGSTLSKAVFIKNYAHFLIQGCLIDGSVEQSITNGIFIQNCGVNVGLKQIEGNTIVGCTDTGLTLYASFGDIRLNQITGNGYGVKLLNNCNIDRFSGNCEATTGADTQYIHDNTFNELYMTANCVPERFRYNYINDDDNIPFVYHDVTVSFGNPVGPIRDPINVKYNYWGSNFSPSTHLYTNSNTGYEYTPCWNMGICMDDDLSGAGRLLSEADSLNNIGEYARAKTVFMLVVENYPNTICAETALKSLLILEAFAGNHYDTLKSYYQNNIVITSDENLRHLASSLANKCDEKLENYNEAIAWYENVLMDPNTSFNDSIFAAIDLGDLYLKMEAGGEKAIGKLEKYRPKSAIEHELQTDRALSLLPREISIEQGLSELSPIRDLNSSVGNNDTVLLTWDLPSDSNLEPMTLSWLMNDTINDHVQAGYDSYMGNLYDTLDLRNLIGWKIETVSFYKCSNWTHVVYVFEQKCGEEMRVLYNQEISDEMPFGLNTIRLEEDLVIEPNTRYWFALRITHHQGQQGYTYPFGVVCGEQGIEGKSNLCLMPGSNSWFEIPLPNEHFWIRACLVHPENIQSNKDDQSLTGYRVYRDGVHIKEIPYSFVTYFTDTEFTKGYDVEYCVTAVYGNGESEPVCVTANITGVADEFGDDGISVSPNPTNGLIHIEGAEVSEIQVYNTLGQLVKTAQNTNEIDLSGLIPGVYSLRIKDLHQMVTNKKVVVKQD